MLSGVAPVGGLSQHELDQLCAAEGADEESAEPMSGALYSAKRRRRITFSGMGAEVLKMVCEGAAEEEEDETGSRDLRGGLTQVALDGLTVASDHSRGVRDDSPVGDALYRKKRSRVSAGGAGLENMVEVAHETLCEASPADSPRKPRGQRPGLESSRGEEENASPARSPKAPREQRQELENLCAEASLVGKMTPTTPPRQTPRPTPLSPINLDNDVA